jgi:hypothetical protein
MGLSHSPKIATDGLVFYYDMGNPQKSWKGAPATNLFTETNLNNWSKTAITATSNLITPFGNPSYEITDNNTSYLNISRNVTVANDTSSYTIGLFVRKTYGATSARLGFNSGFNGGTQVAVNQRFNSDTGVATDGSVIDYSDWWYWCFTITNNGSGNTNLYCQFFPATGFYNSSDNPNATGTAIIGEMMLVAGSTAVRFAEGTRTNTQAILDLTNRNTITATSLTYASDGSFSFNGSSDQLQMSTFNMDALNSDQITLEAWVNHNNFTGSQAYINNWHSFTTDQRGVILRTFNGVAYPSFWWCWGTENGNNSYAAVSASSTTLSTNTWYHVVGTYKKNDAAKIYVNGALINSTTGSVDKDIVYDTTNRFNIGQSNINSSWMDGQISLAKIYNRALTADEVAQNFNALRGRYGI